MSNNQIQPTYFNIVVWMDASFVSNFNNIQAAKAYAEPKVEAAIAHLNTLFQSYQLQFKLIFFPVNSLAPTRTTSNLNEWILLQINPTFNAAYPCIDRDCIVVLSNSFSTGGGHGNNRVALISGLTLPTQLVAHEIGHNLGLTHPGASCLHDCLFYPSFMCETSGPIRFNDCDYEQLGDTDYGVFTFGPHCHGCHCTEWTDVYDEALPEDYSCNQEPVVSLLTDQPYLATGCEPDRSKAMLTVTVRGNSFGVTSGTLRLKYDERIYNWDSQTMGMDFHQSIPINASQNELLMVQNGQELLINLAPNESRTFHTGIVFAPDSGIDLANNTLLRITASFRFLQNGQNVTKESIAGPMAALPVSGTLGILSIGQPIFVTDDLVISSDKVLNTPLILVDNGASIAIQNNAKVTSSKIASIPATAIEGCSTMWQGIAVGSGASLDIENVTIKDAQFGVSVAGTLYARNCHFFNNNIAISVGQKSFQAPEITANVSLLGNLYGTTGSGLKPPFPGQAPLPLEKGFAGIYLRNSGAVVLDQSPGDVAPNQFFNLKYGVVAKEADLLIKNALFADITRTDKGTGYENIAPGPTGKAVYLENGQLNINTEVSFANCHTGVETFRASTFIDHTMMDEMTNGIVLTNNLFSTLENNQIRASDRGIELRQSSPIYAKPGAPLTAIGGIRDNTITMSGNAKAVAINTAGNKPVGIDINGNLTSPPLFAGGIISGNYLALEEGAAGIALNAVQRIMVFDNTIALQNSQSNCRGIQLNAGEQNYLSCNSIIDQGASDNTGIYAIHADRPKIRCNLTENNTTGIHIDGLLVGKANAEIAGNEMNNNANGLLYGVSASTGPQVHKGNVWNGSNSTNAQHLGGVGIAIQSKYTIDVLENTLFLPHTVIPQPWFEDTKLAGNSYLCPAPAGSCIKVDELAGESPNQATDEAIANDGQSLGEYAAANNWLAQRRLLERLLAEGNPFPGSATLSAFLSDAQTNGLADYANMQLAIEALFALSRNDQDSLQAHDGQVADGLDSLARMEQQLFLPGISAQDSAALSVNRFAVLSAVLASARSRGELLNALDSIRAVSAGNLTVQNSNLPDLGVACALKEKVVNDVVLRSLASGNYAFSTQDSLVLDAVARSCPLSDGEAVLWARALLALTHDTPVVYDDAALCAAQRTSLGHESAAAGIRVYPNPATHLLTVTYNARDKETRRFWLINGIGQVVVEAELPAQQEMIRIPVAHLPPGLYWYRSKTGATAAAGKVILHHR